MKTLLALFALWSIGLSPALTQECQPDLSGAIDQLTQAQAAFNEGDTETGITQLSEARQVLALEEAACINYAPETAGDKRSNPVPLGQRQSFEYSIDEAAIEIAGYTDNANATSESEPPKDKRYILITVNYYCEGGTDAQCAPDLNMFSGVGDKGIQYLAAFDYTLYTMYPPMLFGGGETQFEIPFLVDEDESGMILILNASSPGQVYFATE